MAVDLGASIRELAGIMLLRYRFLEGTPRTHARAHTMSCSLAGDADIETSQPTPIRSCKPPVKN